MVFSNFIYSLEESENYLLLVNLFLGVFFFFSIYMVYDFYVTFGYIQSQSTILNGVTLTTIRYLKDQIVISFIVGITFLLSLSSYMKVRGILKEIQELEP